jgi:DNA-binding transcriptional ArsR family regulator
MMGQQAPKSELNDVLLALADPTRRSILERLGQGEARVTDLAEPFPISLNSVSKHIRMLERANLVRRRRSGREYLLSVNPASLDQVAEWIARQRAFWTAQLDNIDRLLEEEDRQAPDSTGENAP